MTNQELLEQIAAAKKQVYDNPGCGCEDCREARMVLRRTIGFTGD